MLNSQFRRTFRALLIISALTALPSSALDSKRMPILFASLIQKWRRDLRQELVSLFLFR